MHLGGASMLQLVTTDHKSIYMTSHTKKQLHAAFLAPAVTVGETEGAMDSASVFFASSFAYNFVKK